MGYNSFNIIFEKKISCSCTALYKNKQISFNTIKSLKRIVFGDYDSHSNDQITRCSKLQFITTEKIND